VQVFFSQEEPEAHLSRRPRREASGSRRGAARTSRKQESYTVDEQFKYGP